ncbi:MAG: 16S rRNA processing protein RimM [Elusimicrobia bacterium RIFOXYA2_FULL_39_19]|nr:MAG: 16S rRNA processing protein RimM [Elusimicrobia bacterium RIFOXYA2_FULL_39_19]
MGTFEKRLLKVGFIVKTHGIKGELSAEINSKHCLTPGQHIFLEKKDDLQGPFEIESIRQFNNLWLLKIIKIDNIDIAKKVQGYSIGINLEKLPENVFWVDDLIGCEVFSDANENIGKVTELFKTGSNDVLIVKRKDNTERLIPVTKEIIKSIDTENKKVVIKPLSGLLDDKEV